MPTEEEHLDLSLAGDGALVLVGEIDSYTAPLLGERLLDGSPIEVVDLAGVSFIDSSGLRVLVEAHQARVDQGARLVAARPERGRPAAARDQRADGAPRRHRPDVPVGTVSWGGLEDEHRHAAVDRGVLTGELGLPFGDLLSREHLGQ